MANVRKKSLILLLILTLSFGIIPFQGEMFQANAATTAKPSVTAKKYTKKAGRYTVSVKQVKVDYKTVRVYLPGVKTLKKVKSKKNKVYKVKATAYMYCDGKVVKSHSKTMKLSKISSSKKYFTMVPPAMGKYNFVVKYYNKKGKKLKTVTLKNAGVIAQEYNMAVTNGTFGPLLLSLSFWDITKGEKGNPIPTTLSTTRRGTYNWSKMPPYVQTNPKMKKTTTNMGKMLSYMSKYISDLRSLNKDSKFHIYLTDNNVKGILELACRTKLPENRYDVTMLSDGSGTYVSFNKVYGGADAQHVYDVMRPEWKLYKSAWKKGNYIDISDAKYYTKNVNYGLERYSYVALSTASNVKWWVGRKDGTFESKDEAFLTQAKSKIEQKNMNDMLNKLKEEKHDQAFKAWYHFSDSMFADAKKNNKKVMVLMGGRVTSEKDFAEFTAFVKNYYGNGYEYYYKGHPGTPTRLYPEKQKQLDAAKVHDVESSIPAELILFFYPDIYCSGMSNSTMNYSYRDGRTCAYLGMRKDKALAKDDKGNQGVIEGQKFQLFFTALTDAEVQAGKVGTITLPKNHKCYMVEFNGNSKYEYAVYDYTANKIIYPETQAESPKADTTVVGSEMKTEEDSKPVVTETESNQTNSNEQ
ncbi:MAG: hypothetical protein Q4C18_02865 [Eubacteriales bacterium]|nr:hypothetical protein [Eubacteriales bacterium]